MTRESVVYDDFTKGEYGDLGARVAGRTPGYFTAKNMVRYRDGLVGPRAGIKSLGGITGMPNGTVNGLGLAGSEGWIAIGATVYLVPWSAGGAVTAYTMTNSLPTSYTLPPACLDSVNKSYVSVYGDFLYQLDHLTTTVTKITGAPGARAICLYGSVLVACGTTTYPYRLFFSDPGPPFSTWGALSYVDIGDESPITSVKPFRNGLLVGKKNGEFHYVTGVLGSTTVVRRLTTAGAPGDEAKAVALGADKLAFFSEYRSWVDLYNGAVPEALAHLRFMGENYTNDTTKSPKARIIRLTGPEDFLALSGVTATGATNRALLVMGDPPVGPIPTYHTWEQNISGWAVPLMQGGFGEAILVKDGVAGTTPPTVYTFITRIDRPGFAGDTTLRPGDDSTTPFDAYLHLPQFWADDGSEVQVVEVVVDFRKWDTGSGTNNHFDLTVRAVSRYNTAAALASSAQSFDEAGGSASTAGTDDRRSFYFGEQGYGGGFEIYLDAIKGIAIRSVTVRFERQSAR